MGRYIIFRKVLRNAEGGGVGGVKFPGKKRYGSMSLAVQGGGWVLIFHKKVFRNT